MTGDYEPMCLDDIVRAIEGTRRPPIHLWHPEREQALDMRIAKNGDWFHEGRKIQRNRMVKLFASLLRREGEQHYLITPPVKYRLSVDVAPFVAVLLQRLGEGVEQSLVLTTNLDEHVVADEAHPLRVDYQGTEEEPLPFIRVRGALDALIARSVFVELGNLAVVHDGRTGVWSRGQFMVLDRV